ncbi:MAG TPA: terminase family protein [Rhizomicrobium sp.]|nr:terminase family protein [Rhizomicrobium sp.]
MNIESILCLPPEDCRLFLDELSDDALKFFTQWEKFARSEQLAPQGAWRTWLFLGGRGAGKTRAGAEWIVTGIREGKMRRVALVGATYADARAVMIEGESGLLRVDDSAIYQPSNQRVLWPSGAIATILSAEEPDGFRGHQFDAAWGDEFCKWRDPQAALDMLRMTLRIGKKPRLMLTTTPRNIPALKTLMKEKGVAHTHGTTRSNIANLAPGFVEGLEMRFAGTRLGRQELDAEIIADNDAALWRRDWIETTRVREAPELTRIVVAVDPSVSVTGDECGIVVVGADEIGDAYVIADRSRGGLTPNQWASRVADAYVEFEADSIVAEANQGGEMVRTLLRDPLPNAPVKLVHARRGKTTRATPAATLYERGRVHHVGVFPELEDQMCNYDGTGESPDRMDALVWGLAELFPDVRAPKPSVRSL